MFNKNSSTSFINNLIKTAKNTFSEHLKSCPAYVAKPKNQACIECISDKNLKLLQSLMDSLVPEHINYKPPYLINNTTFWNKNLSLKKPNLLNLSKSMPVGYINIYEDETLSVSVFSLPSFSNLPLHDHPGMHGLIKVIYGTIYVDSFNPITVQHFDNNHKLMVHANSHKQKFLNHSDKTVLLTPFNSNIHKISTSDSPGTFIDILSPPYNMALGRDCHYFTIIEETCEKVNNGIDVDKKVDQDYKKNVELKEIEAPSYYTCLSYPYTGPKINIA